VFAQDNILRAVLISKIYHVALPTNIELGRKNLPAQTLIGDEDKSLFKQY